MTPTADTNCSIRVQVSVTGIFPLLSQACIAHSGYITSCATLPTKHILNCHNNVANAAQITLTKRQPARRSSLYRYQPYVPHIIERQSTTLQQCQCQESHNKIIRIWRAREKIDGIWFHCQCHCYMAGPWMSYHFTIASFFIYIIHSTTIQLMLVLYDTFTATLSGWGLFFLLLHSVYR